MMPYFKENDRARVKVNCNGVPQHLWGKEVVVDRIAPRLGDRKPDGSCQRRNPDDEYFKVRCDGVNESFSVLGSCLEYVKAKFNKGDKVRVKQNCEGACERLKGKVLIVLSSKEIENFDFLVKSPV